MNPGTSLIRSQKSGVRSQEAARETCFYRFLIPAVHKGDRRFELISQEYLLRTLRAVDPEHCVPRKAYQDYAVKSVKPRRQNIA